jgi:hypothetical protein
MLIPNKFDPNELILCDKCGWRRLAKYALANLKDIVRCPMCITQPLVSATAEGGYKIPKCFQAELELLITQPNVIVYS